VTFKDFQKLVQESSTSSEQQNKLFERLRNKPFWIWNVEQHKQEDRRTKGDCCFNHIIGLSQKKNVNMYMYMNTTGLVGI
jgi:hypothetical protein